MKMVGRAYMKLASVMAPKGRKQVPSQAELSRSKCWESLGARCLQGMNTCEWQGQEPDYAESEVKSPCPSRRPSRPGALEHQCWAESKMGGQLGLPSGHPTDGWQVLPWRETQAVHLCATRVPPWCHLDSLLHIHSGSLSFKFPGGFSSSVET